MHPLVVVLDFAQETAALALVDKLSPKQCALKVGSEMFTHLGPHFVKTLIARGYQVFLDLKFHDIPNTVAGACKAAADLGVSMLTLHASGGLEMMQAAKKALANYTHPPLLVGVTMLTSLKPEALPTLGIAKSMPEQVCHLARLAKTAGLDGIVCSPWEAKAIRQASGEDFIIVTPGIRPVAHQPDDQTRIMTAAEALAAGSDHLVIGRPITQSTDPQAMVTQFLQEIALAC